MIRYMNKLIAINFFLPHFYGPKSIKLHDLINQEFSSLNFNKSRK